MLNPRKAICQHKISLVSQQEVEKSKSIGLHGSATNNVPKEVTAAIDASMLQTCIRCTGKKIEPQARISFCEEKFVWLSLSRF